jgi:hypothetical protein
VHDRTAIAVSPIARDDRARCRFAALVHNRFAAAPLLVIKQIEVAVVVDVAGRERRLTSSGENPGPALPSCPTKRLAVLRSSRFRCQLWRRRGACAALAITWPFANRDVEARVVVVVHEAHAEPTYGRVTGPTPLGAVSPRTDPTKVQEEAVHLGLVIGDDQAAAAGAGEIANAVPMPARAFPSADTATPASSAVSVNVAVALVVKQEVRHAVVGHEHVGPPSSSTSDTATPRPLPRYFATPLDALMSSKLPWPVLR